MKTSIIEVAAGLVFREGRLLITQRKAGDHLGGLWEFPGGKRHAHETFEQCLHRELEEELGIGVTVDELFEAIDWEYPEKTVHLRFYRCTWCQHEPRLLECQAIAWVGPKQLNLYRFPAADARLLDRLSNTPEVWL